MQEAECDVLCMWGYSHSKYVDQEFSLPSPVVGPILKEDQS